MRSSIMFYVGLVIVIIAAILWIVDVSRIVVFILGIAGLATATYAALKYVKLETRN